MLSHSGAKVILLEDAAQAAKIATVRDALPELEHVIVLTGEAEGAITLADLRSRGAGSDVADERVAAVNPDDPATIVYTSGTTGPPKGCVLSAREPALHRGRVHRPAGACATRRRSSSSTCRWPTCWRGWCPSSRSTPAGRWPSGAATTAKLAEDIGEAKPTHIPTVPRLLEKIHTRVVGTAAAAGGAKAQIFTRALATGEKVAKAKREGRKVSAIDRARHAAGDKLALSKVRDALGPNDPVLVTGAAPIGTEVIEFFYACGVPVLEGYGMTETCAAATLNTVGEVQVGQRRPAAARDRGLDRRRRRDPDARPAHLPGLSPQRGGDGRDHGRTTAGCTPATSARSSTATSASPAARRT